MTLIADVNVIASVHILYPARNPPVSDKGQLLDDHPQGCVRNNYTIKYSNRCFILYRYMADFFPNVRKELTVFPHESNIYK